VAVAGAADGAHGLFAVQRHLRRCVQSTPRCRDGTTVSCARTNAQRPERQPKLTPPPPLNNDKNKTNKQTTELYYVYASVWGHKMFVVWPVLALVFFLLVVVTAFVTVSSTFFLLASEDHRWWWRAFLCGGSTAFYVVGYSVYYWFFRSTMSGFFQGSFFFLNSGLAAYALFLLLGTVGFRSSELFVKKIFAAIKID
jgi:hypothetical protein